MECFKMARIGQMAHKRSRNVEYLPENLSPTTLPWSNLGHIGFTLTRWDNFQTVSERLSLFIPRTRLTHTMQSTRSASRYLSGYHDLTALDIFLGLVSSNNVRSLT